MTEVPRCRVSTNLVANGRSATAEDFFRRQAGGVKVLEDMSFDVVVDEQAVAKQSKSRTGPLKPRKATPDKASNICPTCFMAIPSTGVCDNGD